MFLIVTDVRENGIDPIMIFFIATDLKWLDAIPNFLLIHKWMDLHTKGPSGKTLTVLLRASTECWLESSVNLQKFAALCLYYTFA